MAEIKVPAERLNTVIDAYLTYAKLEKGLARNTITAYARDLARFAEPLEGILAAEINREHIKAFIEALERDGLSPASRARALVAVRRLLKFMCAEQLIEKDPSQGILAP